MIKSMELQYGRDIITSFADKYIQNNDIDVLSVLNIKSTNAFCLEYCQNEKLQSLTREIGLTHSMWKASCVN